LAVDMELVELEQSDIDYLRDHSVSRGIFGKLPERTEWSYALRHEGETICAGGVILLTHTTAWIWADLSDKAYGHMISTYRLMRDWLDVLARNHGIKRMQAYTLVGFEEAERTIEHLGFTRESRMRNFVDDQPADMWVKLYDEVQDEQPIQ
jgi:RimJ/RimL family protein N-acetyltransferase